MQANTIPATFWALAFLLLPDNQDHKQHILLALQSTNTHTSGPDAQAQQQMSSDGKPSAADGGSAAVAAGMAAAAPGFDAAAHSEVSAARSPEAATCETGAPAIDTENAPPDARGPYSKKCLSSNSEFNSDLSEQCAQWTVRSIDCLILLSLHAPNCCYKCQQICSCFVQPHVAFVHADVTSIHAHPVPRLHAVLTNASSPRCNLQLCWAVQKCCHILIL